MAIEMASNVGEEGKRDHQEEEQDELLKGVRHLCENGITRLPHRYVLPVADRPGAAERSPAAAGTVSLKLPVIDMARLRVPGERASVLGALDHACREYGFFQVVNHGVGCGVVSGMMGVAKRFFEQPFEERARHMSSDIRSPVRYGTSFNQVNDAVFCWRDFLKLACHPLDTLAHSWPASPPDLREVVSEYARTNKSLFKELMEAILEAMGIGRGSGRILDEFENGSHLIVVNCFPVCPQPDLTLGMPPHSDYGFLTLLLQDEVEGLQVQHAGEWVTVQPVANSFVVNIGDHLEIYSNGRYKSVLHRVRVNSTKSRISVASLHSLPSDRVIGPAPELVDDRNPRRYMDTDFATFLNYLTSSEGKHKSFLASRRLT